MTAGLPRTSDWHGVIAASCHAMQRAFTFFRWFRSAATNASRVASAGSFGDGAMASPATLRRMSIAIDIQTSGDHHPGARSPKPTAKGTAMSFMGHAVRAASALVLMALCCVGTAADRWPPTDAQLRADHPGAAIAQRLDADLDGDGNPETILALSYDDAVDRDAYRSVEVLWQHRARRNARSDEDDEEPNNLLSLPASPLGTPHLQVRHGVLLIEDLAGGTTATQTTYRYRHDKDADDMRLIGLDAERYSRTGAHGSTRLSWNVLTGAQLFQRSTVGADGTLRYGGERRRIDKTRTYYYIADTPDPDELLDALPD